MHHLHDGPRPAFTAKPIPGRTDRASLAALQWAADRAGLSYGRFIQSLRPMDEMRIQREYEAFLTAREKEMVVKRAARVAINEEQ